MLPDKRPRLIFFLYLITMAQYKSKIYRKIGYRESVFSSLSSRHLPAILNITKRAFGLVLVPPLKSTADETADSIKTVCAIS